MKTTIYLIGIALGLALGATTANATGGNDGCKPKNGGYSCDVGGTNYNVANATSEASAMAAAIAFQQQSQNQSQTSVNQNVNSNTATGGNVNYEGGDVYAAPAPAASADGWCYTTYVGGVCSPLKSRMVERRQDLIDRCLAKTGKAYVICIANIDDIVQIKRALRQGGVYGN